LVEEGRGVTRADAEKTIFSTERGCQTKGETVVFVTDAGEGKKGIEANIEKVWKYGKSQNRSKSKVLRNLPGAKRRIKQPQRGG